MKHIVDNSGAKTAPFVYRVVDDEGKSRVISKHKTIDAAKKALQEAMNG